MAHAAKGKRAKARKRRTAARHQAKEQQDVQRFNAATTAAERGKYAQVHMVFERAAGSRCPWTEDHATRAVRQYVQRFMDPHVHREFLRIQQQGFDAVQVEPLFKASELKFRTWPKVFHHKLTDAERKDPGVARVLAFCRESGKADRVLLIVWPRIAKATGVSIRAYVGLASEFYADWRHEGLSAGKGTPFIDGRGAPDEAPSQQRPANEPGFGSACAQCQARNRSPDLPKHARCARCQIASYCSKACQKLHWPVHKPFCRAPLAVGEAVTLVDKDVVVL